MQQMHRYVALVELQFHHQDNPAQVVSREQNVIFNTDRQFLSALNLGRINQLAQHQFSRVIPNADEFVVVDSLIKNISYIGQSTDDDFHDLPKPVQEALESLDKAEAEIAEHLASEDDEG